MADNQAKKEQKKKKAQAKQEKADRADKRRQNSDKGKSLEDMLMYVDEFGNLSSAPPNPARTQTINADEIVFQHRKQQDMPEEAEQLRNGKLGYFSQAKGFGFITDTQTGDRVFVHVSELPHPINENDQVTFIRNKNPKGFFATNVSVVKS